MAQQLVRQNLTEFFRDLLQEAMRSQKVETSEDSEFYVVKLLEGFASTEANWFARPLALEYLESFHVPPANRYGKLRRVGDTALFVSGVFMESLHRQLVSSDYYMALGRNAYAQLATLASAGTQRDGVFVELGERFDDLVRVLSEISFEQLFRGDSHTLRIYTRWLYARGERDAQWLLRHGIVPYDPGTKLSH